MGAGDSWHNGVNSFGHNCCCEEGIPVWWFGGGRNVVGTGFCMGWGWTVDDVHLGHLTTSPPGCGASCAVHACCYSHIKLNNVLWMQCFSHKTLTRKEWPCEVHKIPDNADTDWLRLRLRQWLDLAALQNFHPSKNLLSVRFISASKRRQTQIMCLNISISGVQVLLANYVKNIKLQRRIKTQQKGRTEKPDTRRVAACRPFWNQTVRW